MNLFLESAIVTRHLHITCDGDCETEVLGTLFKRVQNVQVLKLQGSAAGVVEPEVVIPQCSHPSLLKATLA